MRGNPTGGVNAVPMTSADVSWPRWDFKDCPEKRCPWTGRSLAAPGACRSWVRRSENTAVDVSDAPNTTTRTQLGGADRSRLVVVRLLLQLDRGQDVHDVGGHETARG